MSEFKKWSSFIEKGWISEGSCGIKKAEFDEWSSVVEQKCGMKLIDRTNLWMKVSSITKGWMKFNNKWKLEWNSLNKLNIPPVFEQK